MRLLFYCFRQNGKEFLKRTLSDESRKYRHQMISVNIKITFLSWAMECFEGISMVMVWAFAEEKAFRISALIIQFVVLVLTPCTYILNRETTKQIIVLEDWLNGLKATVLKREDAEVKVNRLEAERRNNAWIFFKPKIMIMLSICFPIALDWLSYI